MYTSLYQHKHFYGVSLFSPNGPTTIVHIFNQYLVLMRLISKIISHKPGSSDFLIVQNRWNIDAISLQNGAAFSQWTSYYSNESTEVHNPRRNSAILTLAHEIHQTDVHRFDVMHKRRG